MLQFALIFFVLWSQSVMAAPDSDEHLSLAQNMLEILDKGEFEDRAPTIHSKNEIILKKERLRTGLYLVYRKNGLGVPQCIYLNSSDPEEFKKNLELMRAITEMIKRNPGRITDVQYINNRDGSIRTMIVDGRSVLVHSRSEESDSLSDIGSLDSFIKGDEDSYKLADDLNLKIDDNSNGLNKDISVSLQDDKKRNLLELQKGINLYGNDQFSAVVPLLTPAIGAKSEVLALAFEKSYISPNTTTGVFDSDKLDTYQSIRVGNAEGTSGKIIFDNQGQLGYSVDQRISLDESDKFWVGISYQDIPNKERIAMVNASIKTSSTGRFHASYGHTSENKQVIQLQHEEDITKRTSLAVNFRDEDHKNFTVFFQVRIKTGAN